MQIEHILATIVVVLFWSCIFSLPIFFLLHLELLVCYSCSLPLFKIVVPLCHTCIHEKYNYFRAFFQFHTAQFCIRIQRFTMEQPRWSECATKRETEKMFVIFDWSTHLMLCFGDTMTMLIPSILFCHILLCWCRLCRFSFMLQRLFFSLLLFASFVFFFGNGMSSRASSPSWFH